MVDIRNIVFSDINSFKSLSRNENPFKDDPENWNTKSENEDEKLNEIKLVEDEDHDLGLKETEDLDMDQIKPAKDKIEPFDYRKFINVRYSLGGFPKENTIEYVTNSDVNSFIKKDTNIKNSKLLNARDPRSERVVVTVQDSKTMVPFIVTLDERNTPKLSPEAQIIKEVMKDHQEIKSSVSESNPNPSGGLVTAAPNIENNAVPQGGNPAEIQSKPNGTNPTKPPTCKSEEVVTVKIAEDYTVLPLMVPMDKGGLFGGGSKPSNDDDKVIDKIMEDVNDLSKLRHGSSGAALEDQPCSMGGSWISAAGGMEIVVPDNQNSSSIELRKTISPVNTNGFLMEGGWTLRMEVPFARTPAVLFIGYRKEGRKIATFIGECRFCNGIEAVTGSWLIARSATGCKDQKSSQALIGDVMRRNNVDKLKESHIEEIAREQRNH